MQTPFLPRVSHWKRLQIQASSSLGATYQGSAMPSFCLVPNVLRALDLTEHRKQYLSGN